MEARRRAAEDDRAATVGKGHGRVETRELRTTTRLAGHLAGEWPGLRQAGLITRTRATAGGTSAETVAFITSLPRSRGSASRLLELNRSHWLVENLLHRARDVAMGEDACATRAGAQAWAALRNAALLLLRQAGLTRVAAALRRFAARALDALALVKTALRI